MHIPDGILSAPVWATLNVGVLPALGVAARQARMHVEDARVPLLGVLGAFVFAAQMVNFPVALGTSGHLIGGTLLACTAGPASATLIMTAILVVQALLFQDGGVLALGANVMSMAVLGVMAGYLPYRVWGAGRLRRAAIFASGLLSVSVSAAAALTFLYVSGIEIPPAFLGVPLVAFLVNGVLEGAITVAVVAAIERMNPAWIQHPGALSRRPALLLAGAALLLAGSGFLIASSAPDGLERLNEALGVADKATTLLATPFADYQARFLSGNVLGQAVAGVLGLAAAYALSVLAMRLLARRRPVANEFQSGD